MTAFPRISVAMVTYNHGQYLERAVRSVMIQTCADDLELVVGEDCSTDNTRAVLKNLCDEFPDRIRPLFRDRNLGRGENFVDVIGSCRGELIALLEGDDYWTDQEKLRKQLGALDAHPDWSLCFHPVSYVDAQGNNLEIQHPSVVKPIWTLAEIMERNQVQTCSAVFRRAAVPLLPPWFEELAIGDWPLFILAAAWGPLGCLPEPMAAYRVHHASSWSSLHQNRRLADTIDMFAVFEMHADPQLRPLIRAQRRRELDRYLTVLQEERERILSSWSMRCGRMLTWPLRALLDMVRSWRNTSSAESHRT